MTDIIGTPVERVIPEGWSVLRCEEVGEGDAMESNGKWMELDRQIRRDKTDANGLLWNAYLVIRRNAPVEPGVEGMRRERDEWKIACRINADNIDRLIAERDELKAKVAELEAEVEQLQASKRSWIAANTGNVLASDAKDAEIEAMRKERDNWKPYFDTLVTKMDAIRKVMEGA